MASSTATTTSSAPTAASTTPAPASTETSSSKTPTVCSSTTSRTADASISSRGHGGKVQYVTELVIDEDEPYYETEAPRPATAQLRRVFVFKFDPTNTVDGTPRSKLDGVLESAVAEVAIENRWTERFFVNPSADEYIAERREQELVLELEAHLRRRGHDAIRLKIVPRGEHRPIFCDLYDKTAGVLIEAKGTVAREALRMAIGRLVDYRQLRPARHQARGPCPRSAPSDLVALLQAPVCTRSRRTAASSRLPSDGRDSTPQCSPRLARRASSRVPLSARCRIRGIRCFFCTPRPRSSTLLRLFLPLDIRASSLLQAKTTMSPLSHPSRRTTGRATIQSQDHGGAGGARPRQAVCARLRGCDRRPQAADLRPRWGRAPRRRLSGHGRGGPRPLSQSVRGAPRSTGRR